MEDMKSLLIDFASALVAAGTLARRIAEAMPGEGTIRVDGETFAQALHEAIHGNRGECSE